ncbi:MAG: hypothetical protein CMH50_09815 [Myxococcales bacterium]|nr:hypothetical protein [Myxococcales bacterium]
MFGSPYLLPSDPLHDKAEQSPFNFSENSFINAIRQRSIHWHRRLKPHSYQFFQRELKPVSVCTSFSTTVSEFTGRKIDNFFIGLLE